MTLPEEVELSCHEEMGKQLDGEWMQQCCGTTCDKDLLEKQFKIEGATEFVDFIKANATGVLCERDVKELFHLWSKSIII